MTIQVNSVGPLTRLEPQRRTGFEVLIDCGAAVFLQFATPAQAALSRTLVCDRLPHERMGASAPDALMPHGA